MPFIFIFIFFLIELSLLIFAISGSFLITILEILITAYIGKRVIAASNHSISQNIREFSKISQFSVSAKKMTGIFGGFLLFIPGFITDSIGLILVINWYINARQVRPANQEYDDFKNEQKSSHNDKDIIDAQYKDISKK